MRRNNSGKQTFQNAQLAEENVTEARAATLHCNFMKKGFSANA